MSKNRLMHSWEQTDAQLFWGEIAPNEHVVQIYENEEAFIDLLQNFVVGGIRAGDSVVMIGTEAHIYRIHEELRIAGFDPFQLKLKEQFIPLDADDMLSQFMVNGWPDPLLFQHAIAEVLTKAKRYNRQVRAFGEMVVILWNQGLREQTIALEELWNKVCETNSFALFCAYPDSCFKHNTPYTIHDVCKTHSRVITTAGENSNDVLYKTV
jgi:hypothetical protein